MAIQFRRGATTQRLAWTGLNGEPLYDTDEKRLYIGDGSTLGGNPVNILSGLTNRIINPCGYIDQRYEGVSVTPSVSNDAYVMDRWLHNTAVPNKMTTQRLLSSPINGFPSYMRMSTANAYTPTTGQYFLLTQRIEANNISDFAFGTSAAKKLKFRFTARASQAGTYGGAIRNGTRAVPFSYTLTQANVAQTFNFTINGDTGGTWTLTGISSALLVHFSFGCNASWKLNVTNTFGADCLCATGTTDLITIPGAWLDITGVELLPLDYEFHSTYRHITQELQLCQRYFEKSYNIGTAIGTGTYVGSHDSALTYNWAATTNSYGSSILYKTSKRTSPTLKLYSAAVGTVNTGTAYTAAAAPEVALQSSHIGENSFQVYIVGNYLGVSFHYTAECEL